MTEGAAGEWRTDSDYPPGQLCIGEFDVGMGFPLYLVFRYTEIGDGWIFAAPGFASEETLYADVDGDCPKRWAILNA